MDTNVKLTICIYSETGECKASSTGKGSVVLKPQTAYTEGDNIVISTSRWPIALSIKFDDKIGAADIWLTADKLSFPIPFGRQCEAYPPEAFNGESSELTACVCDAAEWDSYRNLSENPLDRRGETSYYPHCTASVETRDESVFAARNTIDGVVHPESHGEWPYQSWGDNEHPQAEIRIDFGRTVTVDKAVINLRADFPHDNFWKQATLLFSDGSEQILKLDKTGEDQEFSFAPRDIQWVKLTKLIKGETESLFPALTQWAIYGKSL